MAVGVHIFSQQVAADVVLCQHTAIHIPHVGDIGVAQHDEIVVARLHAVDEKAEVAAGVGAVVVIDLQVAIDVDFDVAAGSHDLHMPPGGEILAGIAGSQVAIAGAVQVDVAVVAIVDHVAGSRIPIRIIGLAESEGGPVVGGGVAIDHQVEFGLEVAVGEIGIRALAGNACGAGPAQFTASNVPVGSAQLTCCLHTIRNLVIGVIVW